MSERDTYRLQEALPIPDLHTPLHELCVRRTSVLVVEDDEDQHHALAFQLERAGFRVISSLDAASGRSSSASFSPDVVLLDLALPGAAEEELLESLGRILHPVEVPVIVLVSSLDPAPTSSHVRERIGAKDPQRGALTCLVKPVDVLALIETIRELVARRCDARAK